MTRDGLPNTVSTSAAGLVPASLLALHVYVPLWLNVSAAMLITAVGAPIEVETEVEAAAEAGTLQATAGLGYPGPVRT